MGGSRSGVGVDHHHKSVSKCQRLFQMRNWTIVIAFIQIVVSFMGLVFFSVIVRQVVILTKSANPSQERVHRGPYYEAPLDFVLMLILIVFLLGGLTVAGVTGIFLLKGAIDKNIEYLRCWTQWINMTILTVFVSSVLGAASFHFHDIHYKLVYPAILAIVIDGVCMWVVEKLIKEIEIAEILTLDEVLSMCNEQENLEEEDVFVEKVPSLTIY